MEQGRITLEEINEISAGLSWVTQLGLKVEEVGNGIARLRLPGSDDLLRPGGTISGPSMMTLADYAMYIAVLGAIGRVELALTTNFSINFLRKPKVGDIRADCRLLKCGRRLAYGEVLLTSEALGPEEIVAHCTATYSIPPKRS